MLKKIKNFKLDDERKAEIKEIAISAATTILVGVTVKLLVYGAVKAVEAAFNNEIPTDEMEI